MAWSKSGSTTTSSAVDDMNITSITASKFNEVLLFGIQGGTGCIPKLTFNDNENTVYADTESYNGGTDSVNVSRAYCADWSSEPSGFAVYDIVDIAGEEKLLIGHTVKSGSSGAGTAPSRYEQASKFVPSPTARITSIEAKSVNAGDKYDTDSNISALGSDGVTTPAPNNVQDNSIFVEKDTGRRYWRTGALAPTYEDDFSTDTLGANTTDATYIDWDGSGAIDLIAPVSVNTGGGDSGWFDLTTVSDSANVVRFSLDTSAITVGAVPQMWIGLSSIGTGDSTTTNDWFGMYIQAAAGNPIILAGHANGVGCNNLSSDSTFTKTLAVEKIWVEIIRTSTTAFTLNIFSDEYVTLTESKTGVTTSVTSTTNFRMITRNHNGASAGFTMKLGDLEFYNGVTSATPATWTYDGPDIEYTADVAGTVLDSTSSGYRYLTFNGSGYLVVNAATTVEALVVGGGGGTQGESGGGGGGAVIKTSAFSLTNSSGSGYRVIVGAGGIGTLSDGGDSSFNGNLSGGGGGAANWGTSTTSNSGRNGGGAGGTSAGHGSGGGGSGGSTVVNAGTGSSGHAGGARGGPHHASGGGGGSAGAGALGGTGAGNDGGGAGGTGTTYSFPTSVVYGKGGGGSGTSSSGNATTGANTGGGGGSGGWTNVSITGASGVVIVKHSV